MTKIDTSAAAVERVAAWGDVYVFEDAKGATNIGAFIRALAAEREALRNEVTKLEGERDEANSTLRYCELQWQETDRVTQSKMLEERARAKAALATARAETGALIERAAALCEAMASQAADAVFCGIPEQARIREGMEAAYSKAATLIRALSPDATAALQALAATAQDEIRRLKDALQKIAAFDTGYLTSSEYARRALDRKGRV